MSISLDHHLHYQCAGWHVQFETKQLLTHVDARSRAQKGLQQPQQQQQQQGHVF